MTDSVSVPAEEVSNELEEKSEGVPAPDESLSDDNKSKAEIIEVTGAWKHGHGTKVGLTVDDIETSLRK